MRDIKWYLKPDSQLLIFHARNSISPFCCTFLLLLRQLKGLLMAVLAGDIQKPGQKTAAWSKAASVVLIKICKPNGDNKLSPY